MAVLEFLYSAILVVRNSSSKRHIGTAALINFFGSECGANSRTALFRVNAVVPFLLKKKWYNRELKLKTSVFGCG